MYSAPQYIHSLNHGGVVHGLQLVCSSLAAHEKRGRVFVLEWWLHLLHTQHQVQVNEPGMEWSTVNTFAIEMIIKGRRVMIAFFVNYSTVAFPYHWPTLKRQQLFGAVANSLEKYSYFPLLLDVRCCVLYYIIYKIQAVRTIYEKPTW